MNNPIQRIMAVYVKSVIMVMLLVAFATAQDKPARIDAFMQKVVDNGQFNGSVLVAERGEVIYKKGFGYADKSWQIPNTPETKFRIGSITKQFVALQIMQLVAAGQMKLDAKITDYLPEYRKDTGDRVTIHHLLTHTSGIPSYTGLPGVWSDSTRNPYSSEYMVAHFLSGDLEFEPGSRFLYNNSGYYLLALIIERVTGKSFEENLRERILTPLNMRNSGVDRNERILPNMAHGYMKQLSGFTNEPYFHMTNALGAGDMYATAEDLYLWDRGLHAGKLLPKKFAETMFTPFLNNYAYGWGVYKVALGESTDSVEVISHTGGINGFNTIIFRLVKDEHLVVMLNNTGGTSLGQMCRAITNILYEHPYEMPAIPIGQKIGATLLAEGLESAIKQYRELKENAPDTYNFSENELNNLGYQLLGMKRIADAIGIFKLNVEMFPEAFNPYDSLGEGYMLNGEKALAIRNYAKSLELNPDNTNAIRMLQKIAAME